MKIFSSLLLSLMLVAAAYAQPKRFNINNDLVSLSSLKSAVLVNDFDISIKNSRPFVLNNLVKDHINVNVGDTLQLDLFIGKSYLSVVESKTTDINGITTLVAKLTNFRFAYCFISISDNTVLLTIDIPERKEKYTTRLHPKNSSLYLIQLDESDRPVFKDSHIIIGNDKKSSDRYQITPNDNLLKSKELNKNSTF